ncbi:MAG: DNA ligase [Hadesarchaea archaeon]|nr:MAG: DNA ligase [Hadesarchaea archaeon]
MEFRRLAELCERLEQTSKRKEKMKMVSSYLSSLPKEEVEPFCHLLLGRPLPPSSPLTLGVDWATLKGILLRVTGLTSSDLFQAFHSTGDLGEAAKLLFQRRKYFSLTLDSKPLELLEVWKVLEKVALENEREKKERLLEGVLNRCTPEEAKLLVKTITGEMRTGFKEEMLLSSLAMAFGMGEEEIRKAFALSSDAGRLAGMLVEGGRERLISLEVVPFQPLEPMLAQPADGIEEILKEHGTSSLEVKLDGARVQIHKSGKEVKIFSRGSKEVTGSLPEVVEEVKGLEVDRVILDGEVIAVDEKGKPLPFQYLLRRFRRKWGVEEKKKEVPVRLQLFDLLYLNGQTFLHLPYSERRERLEEVCGGKVTERILTSSPEEAEEFLKRARKEGHEGIVAKLPNSPYLPGARGKLWLKFKPVPETLDLVIVGAEWGHGRRAKYLSDYYLAAWDGEKGKFEIVGKTFKGLTDEELAEMTERLKALETSTEGRRIWVRPEVVVEVAYNEIQKSPRYPCGMALRLARIVRIREDKRAQEADTIQRMRELFERQGRE